MIHGYGPCKLCGQDVLQNDDSLELARANLNLAKENERLRKALNEIASYHGKYMMGPTDDECAEICDKNDGWDSYRRAFVLGSHKAYSECVAIAREALKASKDVK